MDNLRLAMIFLHTIIIGVVLYLAKSYLDHYGLSRAFQGEDFMVFFIVGAIMISNSIFRIRLLYNHLNRKSITSGTKIGKVFSGLQFFITCFLIFGVFMSRSSSLGSFVGVLILNGILAFIYMNKFDGVFKD